MQLMLRISLALVLILVTASTSTASADLNPHVVISELQTGTTASATQEFLELYNPTSSAQFVAGWTLEYKAATSSDVASSWTKKAVLAGSLNAYGFYLVAPKSYLPDSDADWTATLAASGGNVRLKNADGQVIDQLGYGDSANAAEGGAPAPMPAAGQSIERLPGRLDELAGNGTDTNNNRADFIIRPVPQPQSSVALAEVPGDAAMPIEDGPTAADESPQPVVYLPLQITELFIDPAAPQTDADDEFIELYNPNDVAVDATDYTVRVGSSFKSYYNLPTQSIPPHTYTVLYSRQTKLALANSGGAAQLLDPEGTVVDQTANYDSALTGQSWALIGDVWQWTTQVTPGAPNVLAVLPPPSVKLAAVKASTTKKAAVKSTKTSPKKAATEPKVSKAKAPKKIAQSLTAAAATHNLKPASWLIITLAVLTIGYALYEFRHDFINLYHRFRSDPQAGPEDRATVEPRDGN